MRCQVWVSGCLFNMLLVGSLCLSAGIAEGGETAMTTMSLDGEWLLGVDPGNVGRDEGWFNAPRDDAKPTRVPWIIQEAFPGYHGVAWYWGGFEAIENRSEGGRYLLRFWAVDYKADVWVNGTFVGTHEGGESPFLLDATDAVRPGETNLLAVRVLNPTDSPIDGIVLNQTPHRNKVVQYRAGASYNHGGIVDSVELLVVPEVWVKDVYVRPDWRTGEIHVQTTVESFSAEPYGARLEISVAPAASGATLQVVPLHQELAPSENVVKATLRVEHHRLWELNDPALYRVTVRLMSAETGQLLHEHSVRCGFRDFRFEDGYFRLNGRRVYFQCSHTGNHCPIGQQLPPDPDMLRRDLLNLKTMGFNAVRFIAGVGTRYQLDLCDEIGLMVYEEPYSAWCMEHSPQFAERFDESMRGMLLRDRNHPSITIWGLLNETGDGPVFQYAVDALGMVRELDDTRMVLLNSGRWDSQTGVILRGLELWCGEEGTDPNVSHNPTQRTIKGYGVTWEPGRMGMHPGVNGEYSVVRWTAPKGGDCRVSARFLSIDERATTDVHVLHQGTALFDGFVNLQGGGAEATYEGSVTVAAGHTLDFVLGYGNGNYGADSNGLEATVALNGGETFQAASDFSLGANPNGTWSYGTLKPGPKPEAVTFAVYPVGRTLDEGNGIGSLSNPGSSEWENVLHDKHCYPRVPHTADIVRSLREYRGGNHPVGMGEEGYAREGEREAGELPVFLSEYGIGSAVDLARVVRHYERLGAGRLEDAQYYRAQLNRFLGDWERWGMASAFGRPEDYFTECLAKMAGQRLLGLNAIRANPSFVAHSVTGAVDQGMTGEGLATTTFREFKPGAFDAMFDGLAPLRWCLFAEPLHVYRGGTVRLEAILANEDALSPGTYPVSLAVFGPSSERVFEAETTVTIPGEGGDELPFALPVFKEDVTVEGPTGSYRFVASFKEGAAAAGGEALFHVTDAADFPEVDAPVFVWGGDTDLMEWLRRHDVQAYAFSPNQRKEGEVILVANTPPEAGQEAAFEALLERIRNGSTGVFLSPGVFRQGDDALALLPLEEKGQLKHIGGWLYLKDEWAKEHPVFEGLPAGGLMDYGYYRELIPDLVWSGQGNLTEAIAGANRTSQGYDSGLLMSVHRVGEGRVILNTLRIREHLERHPAADRLLLNLLRYAASS